LPFLEKFHNSIAFQTGDKKDLILGEFLIPGVVIEASIKNNTGARRKLQRSSPLNFDPAIKEWTLG